MKTLICILGVSGLLMAQATPPTVPPQNPPSSKDTMKDQSPSGDSQLASKVRKAITDDPALSTTAHNVKVSSHGGMVTLRGKVNSQDEKDGILAKAKEVAGSTNVKDELTVSASKK
jgi:osmotically-inducible protein OsmY